MRCIHINVLLSCVALLALSAPLHAQDVEIEEMPAPVDVRSDMFELGTIHVVGADPADIGRPPVGGAVVTREQDWTFERRSLEDAVNLAPGVVSTFDSNGRRNESDIFVRGFGRWQVPLMIDGVRIYLPADNRIDFTRLLTADLAGIQIQKGFASVLDGPGGMGGAINLVSRKPVKELEAEAQGGLMFGNEGFEGWHSYARAGMRQEVFYAQASINYLDRDFWSLSDRYRPFPAQGPYPGSLETGGKRINSDNRDWRVNVKVGATPNATDEYSINYIYQEGRKGGLLNVYNNPQQPPNSFWRWPWWNTSSLAFLSNTQIGDASYLKSKLYYNTFDNALDAFDDITYTTRSGNGRFRSLYDDHAYGASVEFGTKLVDWNTFKAAYHYRVDSHTEWQHMRPGAGGAAEYIEPKHTQSQATWSIAAENTIHATDRLDLVVGASYENFKLLRTEEFNLAQGSFEYPKGGTDSFNWQAAAIWRYTDTGRVHASVSDRTRFPGIWEMYSTRFGTAVPNPNLGSERATNYELGWSDQVLPGVRLGGAVFYSDVRDLIQTIDIGGGFTQTQNVGDGRFYGFEVEFDAQLLPELKLGGNYSYINRTIRDALQPGLQPTGVPTHKAFLYLAWEPVERFIITPSLEIASDRWSDVTIGTSPMNQPVRNAFPNSFIRTGAYALVNLQAEYKFTENFEVAAGVRNLLDQNYELAWGFPQQGRNFYLKGRASF